MVNAIFSWDNLFSHQFSKFAPILLSFNKLRNSDICEHQNSSTSRRDHSFLLGGSSNKIRILDARQLKTCFESIFSFPAPDSILYLVVFQKMSARDQARTTSTSPPSFIKVLRRIANSAPGGAGDIQYANLLVNQIYTRYNEVASLNLPDPRKIPSSTRYSHDPAPQMPTMDVMYNIVNSSKATSVINAKCESVGVPFYDEEWVYTYWIPMTRLCVYHSTELENDGVGFIADETMKELLFNIFSKADMTHVSSECKIEILRVLGEVLEGFQLSASRASDTVHTVFRALFDDSPARAETRATRRATANVVLKSNIIKPFLKFIVKPPLEEEEFEVEMNEKKDEVKHDICFIIAFVLTSILGEMDPEIAARHSPELIEAIGSVAPQLWEELTRFGGTRIENLSKNPYDPFPARHEHISRLLGVYMCFQCLGVLSGDNKVVESHSEAIEMLVCALSVVTKKSLNLEPDEAGKIHSNEMILASNRLQQRLPLGENTRAWFAEMAGYIAVRMPLIMNESTRRGILLNEGNNVEANLSSYYPKELTLHPENLSREEMINMRHNLVDDQIRRGLLDEQEKPMVREQRSSDGAVAGEATGAECAFCKVDGVSGSNLKLMRCSGCRSVWYCSTRCQKSHWKAEHKAVCKKK